MIAERTSVAGYERDCGAGGACVFGPAWSDDTTADGGHNGCDTRNDILARDLTHRQVRPGTRGCVVVSGRLEDPYTGQRIKFRKEEASRVQIDHVYPLAAAWDMGASRWTPARRMAFANDPFNLLAVDGSANASKGDKTLGEWMPINRAYRCQYVRAFLEVATKYQLPITSADEKAARHVGLTCQPALNP